MPMTAPSNGLANAEEKFSADLNDIVQRVAISSKRRWHVERLDASKRAALLRTKIDDAERYSTAVTKLESIDRQREARAREFEAAKKEAQAEMVKQRKARWARSADRQRAVRSPSPAAAKRNHTTHNATDETAIPDKRPSSSLSQQKTATRNRIPGTDHSPERPRPTSSLSRRSNPLHPLRTFETPASWQTVPQLNTWEELEAAVARLSQPQVPTALSPPKEMSSSSFFGIRDTPKLDSSALVTSPEFGPTTPAYLRARPSMSFETALETVNRLDALRLSRVAEARKEREEQRLERQKKISTRREANEDRRAQIRLARQQLLETHALHTVITH